MTMPPWEQCHALFVVLPCMVWVKRRDPVRHSSRRESRLERALACSSCMLTYFPCDVNRYCRTLCHGVPCHWVYVAAKSVAGCQVPSCMKKLQAFDPDEGSNRLAGTMYPSCHVSVHRYLYSSYAACAAHVR